MLSSSLDLRVHFPSARAFVCLHLLVRLVLISIRFVLRLFALRIASSSQSRVSNILILEGMIRSDERKT
uniref:Uncharacterized protein n=1 Tax=Romanomermis culicivorax TaxID=13658 RepID=A0A915JKQ6_ROMCU